MSSNIQKEKLTFKNGGYSLAFYSRSDYNKKFILK